MMYVQSHISADLAYIQGELGLEHGAQLARFSISENSTCTQREHNPLPLMKKGESDLGFPSSPRGEIVGIMTQIWHYDTGVVLHGNSIR